MAEANDQRPTRRRRPLVWLGRLLFIGLGLLALVAAIAIAVDRGWQRDRVVAIGLAIAEDSLGLPISVDEMKGRLSLGLELRGVRLGDPAKPLVALDALHVDWHLGSLLGGTEWIVESIRLEGWRLDLHRDSDGRWVEVDQLIARFSTAEDDVSQAVEAGPPLVVRQVEIGEGELNVAIESTESNAQAVGAGLLVRGEIRRLQLDPIQPPSIKNAQLSATLVRSDSGVAEFDDAVSANADLKIVGRRIESLVAKLSATGIEAELSGAGPFESLEEVVLNVDAQDLAPLSGWLQTTLPLTGRLEAQALLSGPIDALVGSLHVDAQNVSIETMSAEELLGDLDFSEPIVTALSAPREMEAAIQLRARRFDRGQFGPFDVDWLPAGEADFEIEGDLVKGELDLREGKLRLAGLDLTATGKLTEERIDGLRMQMQFADVAPWARQLRPDLDVRGGLRGSARLSGPVGDLRGRVELASDGLMVEDRVIEFLDVTLEREGEEKDEGGSADEEPARMTATIGGANGPLLELDAVIHVERERVEFDGSGDLATLARFVDGAPEVEGRFDADGFFENASAGPIFDLAVETEDTVVADRAIGRVVLAGESQDGRNIVVSKFALEGDGQSVALAQPATVRRANDGRWTLDEAEFRVSSADGEAVPGVFRLRAVGMNEAVESIGLSFSEVAMATANPFLSDQTPIGGAMNGQLTWQSRREAGWTQGELEWTAATMAAVKLDQISANWKGGPEAIDLAVTTNVAARSPLSVRGQLFLPSPNAPLAEILSLNHLSMQTELDDFDLSALNALQRGWMRQIAGVLNGTIRVEPGDSGPKLSGRANVRDGGFSVPLLRQRFAPITGILELDNDVLKIKELMIGEADAAATLDGLVHFSEEASPTLDGQIRFDQFPLARSPAVSMNVLGDVQLSGSFDRPVLEGELSIDEGKIGVPSADDPVAKEIRIATRSSSGTLVEPDAARQDLLHDADIDVTFKVPDTTRVRGEGANLFVTGEAHVDKRPTEPLRVKGEARVVAGTYTFQGRLFRVRRGRVLLTGDAKLDPVLDVEARLPVSDIEAIVELSGRMSSPTVRLRSEPPRSDQDVLAYLLFGKPADQVTAAGNSNFGAAAARLVAGVAEQELRGVLGDAMPVDSIEIGADAQGNTSELGFGKYLSPNLFFRYVHVLGDEPADRVGVEYRLNDALSVGSSVSTTGDAGLDLILRKDF